MGATDYKETVRRRLADRWERLMAEDTRTIARTLEYSKRYGFSNEGSRPRSPLLDAKQAVIGARNAEDARYGGSAFHDTRSDRPAS